MSALRDKMETGRGRKDKVGGRALRKEINKFSEGYTHDFMYYFDSFAQKVFNVLTDSKGRFKLEKGEILKSDRGYEIERFSLNDLKDKKGTDIGAVEARKESDGTVTSIFVSAPPRVLFILKEMGENKS